MIVENQSNIKIHFAGLENQDFAMILHECSNIKYSLFTVFPFIAHKFGIKPMKMKAATDKSPLYLQKHSKHTIMDSGLFTLMFGAHAGKRDKNFIYKWQDEIVNYVQTIGYNGTIVEVDCQKVLGVEEAWNLRTKLKDQCSNRQINVFHKEDGKKGLDRLIEFSNYIAISVPELRITNSKTYKTDTVKLASYIKNKKPSIDIHLLGCTEKNMLQQCKFCSSSDSTSWQQVNRFGTISYSDGNITRKAKNKELDSKKLYEKYSHKIIKILNHLDIKVKDNRIDYLSKFALAGALLKQQYTHYAGDQN